MRKNTIRSLWVAGSMLMLFTGCCSYSYRGMVLAPTGPLKVEEKCKLRLSRYTFSNNNPAVIAAVSVYSGAQCDREDIENCLISRFPAVFTADQGGVPIAAEVVVDTNGFETDGFWDMLYYLTLSGLPDRRRCQAKCRLQVSFCDQPAVSSVSTAIQLSDMHARTFWTPFALLVPLQPDNQKCEHREGRVNGFFGGNDLTKHSREVFVSTVASGICSGVAQLNPDDVRRASILNQMKKGSR